MEGHAALIEPPPVDAAATATVNTPSASSASMGPTLWQPGEPYTIILFYRYAELESSVVDGMVESVRERCSSLGLAGRVLLAVEGVNGTLAGAEPAIQSFIQFFTTLHPVFDNIDWKRSHGAGPQLPFPDISIRHVREIINTGVAKQVLSHFVSFDPSTFGGLSAESTGVHLSPRQFHAMLGAGADAGTGGSDAPTPGGADPPAPAPAEAPLVIDVRNNYEHDVGRFEGAVGLDVDTYADSWRLLDDLIEQHQLRTSSRPVLMYCTGGIRCEKASAYMCAAGLQRSRLFQLRGGIHRYLEEFPDGGRFQGRNVVFDARCAVAAPSAAAAPPLAPGGVEERAAALSCAFCSAPDDPVLGRCSVCNAVVAVCGPCYSQRCGEGEFHCRRHTQLCALYFRRLERFDPPQLQQQASGLRALLAACEGYEKKNRRRTLRKQILRIEQQLAIASDSVASG